MKERIEKLKVVLNGIGLVGERRALGLATLGFYASIFVVLSMLLREAPPEAAQWANCILGLGLCYAVGFFALGAGWFWARWFALGLASSGVSLVVWGVIMTRMLPPPLLYFGLSHALMFAALAGAPMAAVYEGRDEWKKRFQLDEQGVLRVRNSVTRAATSLPGLIMLALKPREDAEGMALTLVALLGMGGLVALIRGRTWGVLAIGAAGVGAVTLGLVVKQCTGATMLGMVPLALPQISLVTGVLLLAAFAPFVRPMLRFLSARA